MTREDYINKLMEVLKSKFEMTDADVAEISLLLTVMSDTGAQIITCPVYPQPNYPYWPYKPWNDIIY